MSKKIIFIIGISVLVIGGIVAFPKFSLFMASRKGSCNKETKEFYIRSTTTLEKLTEDLAYQGIIDDSEAFFDVGEYKGLNEENIALGKYLIEPGTPYKTILNGFKLNDAGNGNAEVEVEVTFNNCRDIRELGGKLSKVLLLDSAQFVEILENPKTLDLFEMSR